MNRTHLLLPFVALSLLLSASPVEARPGATQSSGSSGVSSLSLWGVLDPGPVDGAGAGFRLTVPIVPQGILHARVHDELVLELGMDFVHYSDRFGYPGVGYYSYTWNGLLAVGGVAWNFWLTPQLALYPKIDLGWWYGWYGHYNGQYGGYYHDFDGVFLQLAGGLIYRLPSRVDLRIELGSGLLRVGVGIPF
jgi:hypothetical protein